MVGRPADPDDDHVADDDLPPDDLLTGPPDGAGAGATVTDERPPPHAPPPIGPRRLVRSNDDRMIAGVCGGIADYLGVDPTLVRIGFALLSLTGIGLIAYMLGWVLLPEEGDTSPRWRPPWQLALLAVAVWIVANWIDLWDADAITFPLALLVIGGVLVWGARESEVTAERTVERWDPPPVTPTVMEQTGPGRWSWAPATAPDGTTATAPAPAIAPEKARKERRDRTALARSFAIGLGGVLIAIGAMTGAVVLSDDVAPTVVIGLALAGFGVAMTVGSWWGWSRPLAIGGMGLVLALAVVTVIDVPLTGGVGDPVVRPRSLADLPDTERLAVGKLTIDLSDVEFTGEERHIEASVAVGELVVIVPEGVTVELDGEVGAGELDAFDEQDEGWPVDYDRTFESSGPGRIELDLRVGVGHVEVRRG